jgi:hypothetical protein
MTVVAGMTSGEDTADLSQRGPHHALGSDGTLLAPRAFPIDSRQGRLGGERSVHPSGNGDEFGEGRADAGVGHEELDIGMEH